MADSAAGSLPYHEPGIVAILVQASFLLLLNMVNSALDRIVYCGLLGQVLLGICWGTPGAKWLSASAEEVVVQLGYLGLMLLVFQGGLSTSFASLKANLLLSSGVAITGITVPIALSFSLQWLVGATSLQAFAAGAALCSTSLGTTFTVLASSGLTSSRLGIVLTTAAMIDDVVGLVMVQVISNLGSTISAITIIRPILVSLGFAVVAPLACQFLILPLTVSLNRYRETHSSGKIDRIVCLRHTAFVIHTLVLIALATGATYAGTSNLFAAYIAGAVISWWDTEVPHPKNAQTRLVEEKTQPDATQKNNLLTEESTDAAGAGDNGPQNRSTTFGSTIYQEYYKQAVSKILRPFFFASIGFSIPISHMFRSSIIWRGIVYTLLMTLGKLVCGLWLVRFSVVPVQGTLRGRMLNVELPEVPHLWGKSAKTGSSHAFKRDQPQTVSTHEEPSTPKITQTVPRTPSTPKPFSLYPPLILALAMVARGEIGFLISAMAESNGAFSSGHTNSSSESDIFLVVTWAIVLCTIIGPLGVGLSVKRVKKLEERKSKGQEGSGRDVLGVWGVR
ncbi:Sodium/hydrogen exchanger [Lindgomyces ingoldianus]|uniref:Sodium/hydrogen exchanger n=1 Tax=Lindgomyces ingoldianus TaxID=673940 RepID=A0ACB6Q9X4_9PLEO|nr:Sodium/hydrogen exchanger [Lindgomyces ingoldianus]KAF2463719.1 Sodium/hydrogen exchanger [Lindgomyces ingoldianus]